MSKFTRKTSKGDFRTIGIVLEDNIITYYIIFDEKYSTIRAINNDTFASMLSRYKFINTLVHNNVILCNDCDINNLTKYSVNDKNNKITCLETNKIYFLGYKIINNNITSYLCLIGSGIVVELSLHNIIDYVKDNKYSIINAILNENELTPNNNSTLTNLIITEVGNEHN